MTITLRLGDCLNVMAEMEPNSVDSIVTDPPYGLEFMGKDWDHGIPGVRFWREMLRVAKPGAMLLAFGGTRTHHRLMCAIEDAGWEIRDVVMWLYGSGFPKSHAIGKAIDKAAGAEREVVGEYDRYQDGRKRQDLGARANLYEHGCEGRNGYCSLTAPATEAAALWEGWGTGLKPAYEPIIVAMKPRDGTFANNALVHGVAGLWIDGARIPTNGEVQKAAGSPGFGADRDDGYEYGTGREYHQQGRWPANLILDEEAGRLLDEMSGERPSGGRKGLVAHQWTAAGRAGIAIKTPSPREPDTGGASRFFMRFAYVPKASRRERNAGLEGMEEKDEKRYANGKGFAGRTQLEDGTWTNTDYDNRKPIANHHPTVKPLDLMRYLCRLTMTPTGGIVLDPFLGSGTTGMAAVMEGRDFIGIEIDAEYMEIARRRIAWAEGEAETARQLEMAL